MEEGIQVFFFVILKDLFFIYFCAFFYRWFYGSPAHHVKDLIFMCFKVFWEVYGGTVHFSAERIVSE